MALCELSTLTRTRRTRRAPSSRGSTERSGSTVGVHVDAAEAPDQLVAHEAVESCSGVPRSVASRRPHGSAGGCSRSSASTSQAGMQLGPGREDAFESESDSDRTPSAATTVWSTRGSRSGRAPSAACANRGRAKLSTLRSGLRT